MRALGEIVADGGEAARGFGGAGQPFVAVAREGEAGGGGALGLADEAVEGCGCGAFGIAGGADFSARVCEDRAVAVGRRCGEGGLARR